jgi:hypothetical protein
MNSDYLAVPTSGLSIAVAMELLVPDPIDIAKGVEIIQNATLTRPTTNDTKSN